MALKLIDSGDGQRTYDSTKWLGGQGGVTWVAAPSGQTGTWFQNTLANRWTYRPFSMGYTGDTLIVGWRVELPATSPGAVALCQFGYWDGATRVGHLYIEANGTGFRLYDGVSNGTFITSGGSPFAWGSGCRYIEIKVKIHNSAGTVEIRQDEVTLWSVSGIDTQSGATAICNAFAIMGSTAGGSTWGQKYRDVYVAGSDGGTNNDFLGVCRAGVKTVSGAGNSAQFTPSAGSNFQNVDDGTTVDNDTTYNESSTVNQKDTLALTSSGLVSGAVIRGAQSGVVMRKTDADPRSCAQVIRSGGTDYDQTARSLGTSYELDLTVLETDPNTSAAWTQTNLDAIELGYKVTA